MALFSFTRAILAGTPIDVYNEGRMQRDFTYIDDIIEGVVRIIPRPAAGNPLWSSDAPDSASSCAPYRLYNIGNHSPVALLRFIEILEARLGRKADKKFRLAQATEVVITCADIGYLIQAVGFSPTVPVETGYSISSTGIVATIASGIHKKSPDQSYPFSIH